MTGLDADDLAKRSSELALFIRFRAMGLRLNCNAKVVGGEDIYCDSK